MMASGFNSWAGVFSPDGGGSWYALGRMTETRGAMVETLAVCGRLQAIAVADDFLRRHETDRAAKKSARWQNDPASQKQLELLQRFKYEVALFGVHGYTKYNASCHLNFRYAQNLIENQLGVS